MTHPDIYILFVYDIGSNDFVATHIGSTLKGMQIMFNMNYGPDHFVGVVRCVTDKEGRVAWSSSDPLKSKQITEDNVIHDPFLMGGEQPKASDESDPHSFTPDPAKPSGPLWPNVDRSQDENVIPASRPPSDDEQQQMNDFIDDLKS